MQAIYAQAALATFNICLQMFKYIVYLKLHLLLVTLKLSLPLLIHIGAST